MQRLKKYRFSLGFIIAAIVFYGYAQYLWLSVNGAAKSQVIALNQAGNYQFEFVAKRDNNYELSLDVVRDGTSAAQQCLLGIQTPDCVATDEKLNIAWSVVLNGQMIHAGQSQKSKRGSTGSTVSKVLTDFNAHKDEVYQISTQVKEPDKRLSEGSIVIGLNVLLRKETAIKQSFYSAIACVLLLLAGLIWLFNYLKPKLSNKTTNDPTEPLV